MKYPLFYTSVCALLATACASHRPAPVVASAASQDPQLASQQRAEPAQVATREVLPELSVGALLAPGPELKPSAEALALSGTRMRLVGFVAELEEPLSEALYLTSVPVRCDEAGGGTADLPPDAVLVSGLALAGKAPSHVSGPVEAVGLFNVGNRADASGRVSNFQLVLDDGSALPAEPRTQALQARR